MKKPVLYVNGYFDLKFYYLNSQEVLNENEIKEITSKLQSNDYLISMENKTIMSLINLNKVLYTLSIHPTDDLNYEFETE